MLKKEALEELSKKEKTINKLKEALIWCSGSQDFQEGKKARERWLKLKKRLLK